LDIEELFEILSREEKTSAKHDVVLVNGTKKLVLEKHRIVENGIRFKVTNYYNGDLSIDSVGDEEWIKPKDIDKILKKNI